MSEIPRSLKATLKRLRLSGILHTLDDRLSYARKDSLSMLEFLELVLQDEIERRDQKGLALRLAKATVGGAGHLAEAAEEAPGQLRVNVTSPGGTTQAALEVLMAEDTGFPPLLRRAVKAAAERSKELADGR